MNKILEDELYKQRNNDKINYDLIMNSILDKIEGRPSILIHTCCAVCSTVALERLSQKMDVTMFFYNPNIHPKSEFTRRAIAQQELIDKFNNEFHRDVKMVMGEYKYSEFVKRTKGLEEYSERSGIRCSECYSMRLEVCAQKAEELNYDYWATALTLSPLKNSQVINKIGIEVAKLNNTNFFVSDFKKNKGSVLSKEMCDKFDVYRQCYCGCHYAYSEQGVDISEQLSNAKQYLEKNGSKVTSLPKII